MIELATILTILVLGVQDCEAAVEQCLAGVQLERERCGNRCGDRHDDCLADARSWCEGECAFSPPTGCFQGCLAPRRNACNAARSSCLERCDLDAAQGERECYFDACIETGP